MAAILGLSHSSSIDTRSYHELSPALPTFPGHAPQTPPFSGLQTRAMDLQTSAKRCQAECEQLSLAIKDLRISYKVGNEEFVALERRLTKEIEQLTQTITTCNAKSFPGMTATEITALRKNCEESRAKLAKQIVEGRDIQTSLQDVHLQQEGALTKRLTNAKRQLHEITSQLTLASQATQSLNMRDTSPTSSSEQELWTSFACDAEARKRTLVAAFKERVRFLELQRQRLTHELAIVEAHPKRETLQTEQLAIRRNLATLSEKINELSGVIVAIPTFQEVPRDIRDTGPRLDTYRALRAVEPTLQENLKELRSEHELLSKRNSAIEHELLTLNPDAIRSALQSTKTHLAELQEFHEREMEAVETIITVAAQKVSTPALPGTLEKSPSGSVIPTMHLKDVPIDFLQQIDNALRGATDLISCKRKLRNFLVNKNLDLTEHSHLDAVVADATTIETFKHAVKGFILRGGH